MWPRHPPPFEEMCSPVPCKQAGDAAAAAYAEFCKDALEMGADGRDLDAQSPGDFLVAEIVGDHARYLQLAHRKPEDRRLAARLPQCRIAFGPRQRAGERRLDQAQQLQRMDIE